MICVVTEFADDIMVSRNICEEHIKWLWMDIDRLNKLSTSGPYSSKPFLYMLVKDKNFSNWDWNFAKLGTSYVYTLYNQITTQSEDKVWSTELEDTSCLSHLAIYNIWEST